eukprot:116325-Pyramimonas_sp.AAC.1
MPSPRRPSPPWQSLHQQACWPRANTPMAADADRSQSTVDNDSRMGHHGPPDYDNGESAEDGIPLTKMEPDFGEDEPARPPTRRGATAKPVGGQL